MAVEMGVFIVELEYFILITIIIIINKKKNNNNNNSTKPKSNNIYIQNDFVFTMAGKHCGLLIRVLTQYAV